jgi:hypothetical protein
VGFDSPGDLVGFAGSDQCQACAAAGVDDAPFLSVPDLVEISEVLAELTEKVASTSDNRWSAGIEDPALDTVSVEGDQGQRRGVEDLSQLNSEIAGLLTHEQAGCTPCELITEAQAHGLSLGPKGLLGDAPNLLLVCGEVSRHPSSPCFFLTQSPLAGPVIASLRVVGRMGAVTSDSKNKLFSRLPQWYKE